MGKNFDEKTLDYETLLEEFKKVIKKDALKFTTQREAILRTLYDSDEHLTPEALHRLIGDKYPELKVGIATIYRTLSLLESSNIARSLSFGAQGKKYELDSKEHHDHMICTECGDITEFVDDEIEKRQEKIAKEHNFLMQDHSMQIYGLCENCQNKQ